MSNLEADLLRAHAKGDGEALAHLYGRAADQHGAEPDRAAFYLTQAYVFALEAGLDVAQDYQQHLKSLGKEE